MSIQLGDTTEFIITITAGLLKNQTLPSEDEYKQIVNEAAKKKETTSYLVYCNETLLYSTLAAFLIGVQTTIPSVNTKDVSGCVRSFLVTCRYVCRG